MTSTEVTDTMGANWTAAWKNDSAQVTLFGGLLGDWGDDPRVKDSTVRNQPATYLADANTVAVTWTEAATCAPSGTVGYRLDTSGLPTSEALRIARSLAAA